MQEENRNYQYRSLFWPIMLIGVGVFWLLSNLGVLPEVNFRFLLRLWPVALIAIGFDILFARRYPWLGALTGLGAVALVIALVFLAPSLGIEPSGDLKTLNFDEPVGNAQEASITLDLERYPTTVEALVDSNALIEKPNSIHSPMCALTRVVTHPRRSLSNREPAIITVSISLIWSDETHAGKLASARICPSI